jgi:hypothetical protein
MDVENRANLVTENKQKYYSQYTDNDAEFRKWACSKDEICTYQISREVQLRQGCQLPIIILHLSMTGVQKIIYDKPFV